jgi:hypothetical protein
MTNGVHHSRVRYRNLGRVHLICQAHVVRADAPEGYQGARMVCPCVGRQAEWKASAGFRKSLRIAVPERTLDLEIVKT